ncbi:MAG: glycosyltransferase family 4 protein [bacterium]
MPDKPLKIAYIMSRFPKLTETFVLYEILAMRELADGVEIYPLLRERQPWAHKEAIALSNEAHYEPFFSWQILKAQWRFIRCCPRKYFGMVAEVFGGTLGSSNFFFGAFGIFAKSVKFAYDMASSGVTHVHAHFATHPAVAALIIHRLTGIPFSFTAHGSDLHVERRMLARKVQASKFAVAISSYNKEMMVEESGEACRDKIHVVHCGVEPEVFAFTPAKNNPVFQILCVASYETVKGHQYLIEACRLLAARGHDFECHLIGAGPIQREVEQKIQASGVAERFHVHGGKTRDELLQFLAKADVKVLASVQTANGKREGIPVVLMEAMACGLPVVASRISGIPELVDHEEAGLLFPPGDSNALADALEVLLGNRALRVKMGTKGREKIIKEFDLKKNATELYRLFLGHDKPRPALQRADVIF